jgi:hypothetical protein
VAHFSAPPGRSENHNLKKERGYDIRNRLELERDLRAEEIGTPGREAAILGIGILGFNRQIGGESIGRTEAGFPIAWARVFHTNTAYVTDIFAAQAEPSAQLVVESVLKIDQPVVTNV